jgi:hypothetical protein
MFLTELVSADKNVSSAKILLSQYILYSTSSHYHLRDFTLVK